MQWSAIENAGFTPSDPWLPIAEDYTSRNVESESADSKSMLSLYRRLIELRRREPSLSIGEYVPVPASGDLLSYSRHFDNAASWFIILNFGTESATFSISAGPLHGVIALSTHLDREGEPVRGQFALRPDEGLVIRLVGVDVLPILAANRR